MGALMIIFFILGVLVALTGVLFNYGDKDNYGYLTTFSILLGFNLCGLINFIVIILLGK